MTSTITTSLEAAIAEPWRSFVGESICISWVDQAFQLGLAGGFASRIATIARLVVDIAPRLATSGEVSDAEYDALMREEMNRQLKFLDPARRKMLARHLVAEYATRPTPTGADVQPPPRSKRFV